MVGRRRTAYEDWFRAVARITICLKTLFGLKSANAIARGKPQNGCLLTAHPTHQRVQDCPCLTTNCHCSDGDHVVVRRSQPEKGNTYKRLPSTYDDETYNLASEVAYPGCAQPERSSSRVKDGYSLGSSRPGEPANRSVASVPHAHLNGNVARRKFRTAGFIWDAELRGFALRHTARGFKSWMVQYRERHKTQRITLGAVHDMSAAEARSAARKILANAALDGLPVRLSSKGSPSISFAEYVPIFLSHYSPHWKTSHVAEQSRLHPQAS